VNEPKEFSPLEQFKREQEIAKAKIEAARAGLISYFQRKLQALADDWRAADGVLNWQMPEFGQALSELGLEPKAEAKKPIHKVGHKSVSWSARWEKREALLEPCFDERGLIKAGNARAVGMEKPEWDRMVKHMLGQGLWERMGRGLYRKLVK